MQDYQDFKNVKESVKIEDVVSSYIALKPSGANRVGCCPFHNEKSASFTVSPAKQIFSCFGCGVSGDVIKFVELYENIKPVQAMTKIANTYGVHIEDRSRPDLDAADDPFLINKAAAKAFVANFSNADREVKRWLVSRGINSKELLAKWDLGLATWDAPLSYSQELQKTLGLLNQNGKCPFGGRLMFGLKDFMGRYVGFAGRALSESKAKYINSQESEVFKKKTFLYGECYAAKSIKQAESAIIVEGYFDVINMHAVGYENTVGTCGTSLTVEHAKAIAKRANFAFLFLDGDMWKEEKMHILEKALLTLWSQGIGVVLLKPPIDSDPADMALTYGDQAIGACQKVTAAEFLKLRGFSLEQAAKALKQLKGNVMHANQVRNDICLLYGCSIILLNRLVRQM